MTLADWLATAWAIDRRRPSAAKYAALGRHLRDFPSNEVATELDLSLLRRITVLLEGRPHTGFARPHRGHRGAALHTPLIVALKNRVARLEAAGVGGKAPPPE